MQLFIQQNCLYALLTTTPVFFSVPGVNPAGNYMFKVNNRNTRTRCEIYSKLTIKIPERSIINFAIVNFEHVMTGWEGVTKIVQACESCCMPGFCASIVLVFISGVKLFDYIINRGGYNRAWLGVTNWGIWLQEKGNQTLRMACQYY